MCELRKEFEKTILFKRMSENFHIYYDEFGGYKFEFDGAPCFFLNGAFSMFKELKDV